MKNMKVAKKLIVSFLIVAVFAAIVGAVGIYGMTTLKDRDTELYESNLVAISAMADFREAYQQERSLLRELVIYCEDPVIVESTIKNFATYEAAIQNAIKSYEKTIEDEAEETDYFNAKDTYIGTYTTIKQNMYAAAREGDSEKCHALLNEAIPLAAPIAQGLQSSANSNNEWALDMVNSNTDLATLLIVVQIVFLLLAIFVALFFAIYISGLISKPLVTLTAFMKRAGSTGDITMTEDDKRNIAQFAESRDEIGQCIGSTAMFVTHLVDISDQLEKIAGGDLTIDVQTLSPKDVMGVSLSSMIDNLNGMFGEIRMAAEQVSSGAGQVSQGAQGLASGSSEQAASIQELSASLTELQDRTDHNAQDSSKAREANNTTAARLEDSIHSMSQMLEAMRTIDESSSRITKVIKVIDDIAFQTNILALNAAVEAARAGQHGKGFAVVADEVRNLAAKSAEAAKETSALIEGSSARVKEGNEIVAKTNSDLEAAVESARESTRLIEQVTTASIGQANSITEISHGMDQISTVVQANSATAQESAATAQEMSAQSIVMNEVVSRFRLKQGEMPSVRAISQKSGYSSHNDMQSHGGSSGFPIGGKY